MFIRDERTTSSTTVGELSIGTVFEMVIDDVSEGVYMILDGQTRDDIECVNLCTGRTYNIPKDTIAGVLNVELAIKG